ncbi:MAG: M48 family metalloprotease [Pseudonocardiaceae bacterium]
MAYRCRTPGHRVSVAGGGRCSGRRSSTIILVLDDARVVNASASAGHLVAVTRQALQNLTPVQLAGVLAHEFGHHLGSAPE